MKRENFTEEDEVVAMTKGRREKPMKRAALLYWVAEFRSWNRCGRALFPLLCVAVR